MGKYYNLLKKGCFLLHPQRFFSPYPEILNYSITEDCNCNCIMCNVKSLKKANTMDLNDYAALYQDKLFKKVKYIGITGGEPFLKKDLAEHVKLIVNSFPSLISISLITNGTLPNKISADLGQILTFLKPNKIQLNLAISFDGLGCHDYIRGLSGAEAKVLGLTEILRDYQGLRLEIDYTISNQNVDSLAKTYYFFRMRRIPIKFRLSVPLNRLHNREQMEKLQLTKEQKLQVIEFFDQLICQGNVSLLQKYYYQAVREELAGGLTQRVRGCYYRTDAVGMNSHGEIFYCSPSSDIMGGSGCRSLHEIYFDNNNLSYRRKLCLENCATCFHDYNSPLDRHMIQTILAIKLRRINNLLFYLNSKLKCYLNWGPGQKEINAQARGIAVHGWYGTETIGDKAILGGVLQLLKRFYPDANLSVFSSRPALTEDTLGQLHCAAVSVVKYSVANIQNSVRQEELQVFGGGPLMDLPNLFPIEYAFRNSRGNLILGCGIGPLRSKVFRNSVRNIGVNSKHIMLRDTASQMIMAQLLRRQDVESICDPALIYFRNYISPKVRVANTVGFALRAVQRDYLQKRREYIPVKEKFETEVRSLVADLISRNYEPRFIPMCTNFRGGDDRENYLRLFADLEAARGRIVFDNLSLDAAIAMVGSLEIVVAMRFHAIIFAIITETPFMALMYDQGSGKIGNLLKELDLEWLGISIDQATAALMLDKLALIQHKKDEIITKIKAYKARIYRDLDQYCEGYQKRKHAKLEEYG